MTQESRRGRVTILVCDDDEDDRALIGQALGQTHHEINVQFLEDGEQLLDYLLLRGKYAGDAANAPRPGLILLDLNMPRMNGTEALKAIKENETLRHIPVVMLTTSGREEDILGSYQLGANAFIRKPVTYTGLVEAMGVVGRYWLEIVKLSTTTA